MAETDAGTPLRRNSCLAETGGDGGGGGGEGGKEGVGRVRVRGRKE